MTDKPTTGSILDIIAEKSANIEQSTNSNNVRQAINDTLRIQAKREKSTRESTITVKQNDKFNSKTISELIEKEWTEAKKQMPASYWEDKEHVYIQFISGQTKNNFLDFATLNLPAEFRELINKPNSNGEHIERKPINVEINSVRANIKADNIKSTLEQVLEANRNKNALQNFREGKPNPITKARSILFKTNEQGFKVLFGLLEGTLPYVNMATNSKTRLFMKINAKPWTCRDCFAIGRHECKGRLCGNCSNKDHSTKECKIRTKFCSNCKRRGHRAKEVHCPLYLNEIAKEVRKICLPIEYLEDKEMRFNLTRHLQIK